MRTPLLIYTEYKPFQSIFDFLLCPFECSYPSNLYARCVYHCDNNVVDHQIVNILFENNITAQLTFTAFFERCMKEIVIHYTWRNQKQYGIRIITVTRFGKGPGIIEVNQLAKDFSVHSCGDRKMLEDFVEYIKGNKMAKGITSKECPLQSHEMAFLAEKSRLEFSVEDL